MFGCLRLGNRVGLTYTNILCGVACSQRGWDIPYLRTSSDTFPMSCVLSVVFPVVNVASGAPKSVTYIAWLHNVYSIPFVASVLRSDLCLV